MTASSAARTSIRWLVLVPSEPEAYVVRSIAQAHPPGPGLPEQAPSVKTDTAPGGATIGARGARRTTVTTHP